MHNSISIATLKFHKLLKLFSQFDLDQELDSRQKKKPRSISRAEAKKLDTEQYKSEDTEVTDLKKQLLASLGGFDEQPEDNNAQEPKTDAMDLLAGKWPLDLDVERKIFRTRVLVEIRLQIFR